MDGQFYTFGEARGFIYETFKTYWDSSDGWASTSFTTEPEVFYENVQKVEAPKTDVPFVRIFIRHTGGGQDSFGFDGKGSFRQSGFVTVQVFVPKDRAGLTSLDALVNVVKRAFRGQRAVGDGCGIIFRRVRMNEQGPDERFYGANVLADFEYDEEL